MPMPPRFTFFGRPFTGQKTEHYWLIRADMEAEPKTLTGFWFSEFGALPQTPKAKAAGFRPRKG
jgi:hypothetical protein